MKITVMEHQQPGSLPAPGKSCAWIGGKLEKDVDGGYVHLRAMKVDVDLKGLVKLIRSADSNVHLVAGICGMDVVDVLPLGTVSPDNIVALPRSNESFPFQFGQAGMMTIDSDGIAGPQVWKQITMACPALAGAARVEASSSSSNLYAPDGSELTGETGQHTYLHVADASDIPRALVALHKRLILAGFARYKVSATGDILERSAADTQMKVPSQPIYLHPTLHGGITQKKRVEFFKGEEVVDTRVVVPDLTDAEEMTFAEKDAEARAALKAESEATAAAYDQERGKTLPGGAAEARQVRLGKRLSKDWIITLSSGQNVTVGAILAAPKDYHGKTCRDPLEPDYGSKTVAKIYCDGDTPMINSFAHGCRAFHLGEMNMEGRFKPSGADDDEVPRDIVKEYLRLPFPLSCLPPVVAAACMDVQYDVQAPMALVAGSALSVLSVACMGYVDAVRSPTLIGPSSLYITSIARSSERKSTSDRRFAKAIHDHDKNALASFAREMMFYKDRLAVWEVQVSTMEKTYADAIKGQVPDENGEFPGMPNDACTPKDLKAKILDWKAKNPKPTCPACRCLLLDNATVERIYQRLGQYPLVAILSDEGGTFVGSRSMNTESMMATTAALNKIHGGDLLHKETKGDGDKCDNPRGTMHLMLQPGVFASMLSAGGGQARDIGFISRHLICEPESTKGSRLLTGRAEAGTFGIDMFNQRIAEMLKKPVDLDKHGVLICKQVLMSPGARMVWIAYHDRIEKQLAADGAYAGIDDIAGKNAENAARLAVIFAYIEGEEVVSETTMRGACAVAEWYLNESLVLFGLKAESQEVQDAVAVESWIVRHCVKEDVDFVTLNDVAQRITTRSLRKKPGKVRRETAIKMLIDHKRLRFENAGVSVKLFPLPDLLVETKLKCFK